MNEETHDLEKLLTRVGKPAFACLSEPVQPSVSANAKFDAMLKSVFPAIKVLDKQMMTHCLIKLLLDKPDEGLGIVERLEKAHLAYTICGHGAIYGLLNTLESEGLLATRWREVSDRMVKEYTVTEKGTRKVAKLDQAHSLTWTEIAQRIN